MGYDQHMDEKEHLFESSELAPKPGDSDALRRKRRRCVVYARMWNYLNRNDWARNRSALKIYKINFII